MPRRDRPLAFDDNVSDDEHVSLDSVLNVNTLQRYDEVFTPGRIDVELLSDVQDGTQCPGFKRRVRAIVRKHRVSLEEYDTNVEGCAEKLKFFKEVESILRLSQRNFNVMECYGYLKEKRSDGTFFIMRFTEEVLVKFSDIQWNSMIARGQTVVANYFNYDLNEVVKFINLSNLSIGTFCLDRVYFDRQYQLKIGDLRCVETTNKAKSNHDFFNLSLLLLASGMTERCFYTFYFYFVNHLNLSCFVKTARISAEYRMTPKRREKYVLENASKCLTLPKSNPLPEIETLLNTLLEDVAKYLNMRSLQLYSAQIEFTYTMNAFREMYKAGLYEASQWPERLQRAVLIVEEHISRWNKRLTDEDWIEMVMDRYAELLIPVIDATVRDLENSSENEPFMMERFGNRPLNAAEETNILECVIDLSLRKGCSSIASTLLLGGELLGIHFN